MSDSGGNAEKAAENKQPDGQKFPNSEGCISSSDDGMKNPIKLLSMGKEKVIIDIVRARRVGWRLPAPPVSQY